MPTTLRQTSGEARGDLKAFVLGQDFVPTEAFELTGSIDQPNGAGFVLAGEAILGFGQIQVNAPVTPAKTEIIFDLPDELTPINDGNQLGYAWSEGTNSQVPVVFQVWHTETGIRLRISYLADINIVEGDYFDLTGFNIVRQ